MASVGITGIHGNWPSLYGPLLASNESRIYRWADGRRLCEALRGGQFCLLAAAPAASTAADSGGLRAEQVRIPVACRAKDDSSWAESLLAESRRV